MDISRRSMLRMLGAGSALSISQSVVIWGRPTNSWTDNNVNVLTDREELTLKNLATDILIAGGGLAGACAAIAAARNGVRVVLVQDRSRLGGNSSSEIRMHVLGADNRKEMTVRRETGKIEELKLTESATNPQRSFEMRDLILYD